MKTLLIALTLFQFQGSAFAKEAIDITIGSSAEQEASVNALAMGEYYCRYDRPIYALHYRQPGETLGQFVVAFNTFDECLEAAKKANGTLP